MTDPASLIAEAREWQKVKPEAVCGGSDAQAINVFRDALADIRRLADALEAATQWQMLTHTDEEHARLYEMDRIMVAIEVHNRATGTRRWQMDTVSFDDETGEIVEDTGWTLRDYTWWLPLPQSPEKSE